MSKLKGIFALMALMLLLTGMTVSAETETEASGITINNVTYAVSETDADLIHVTASCMASDNVTSVSVLFVPENTEIISPDKIIYINRFGKTPDGTYSFTLRKSKITAVCGVENFNLANVSLRMGCNVSDSPAVQMLSFNNVTVTEIIPIRTYSVAFDNEAKKITVKALSGNATAGFGIETEEPSTWSVNEADKARLGLTVVNASDLDGAQVVVAKMANGMQQTFEVDITCGAKTETYIVNFEFIDESLINFTDILGLRIYSYNVNWKNHEASLIADRYNSGSTSAGFGLVLPENVTAQYTLTETTDGGTTVSRPVSENYTSTYLGMESGYYGAMPLRVMPMANGATQKTQVVLTNSVLNVSVTWNINLLFRDPAYEGNVNISEIIGLRTVSTDFDNEEKTITLVADASQSSAGCTVISDNPSSMRQLTAESGNNLAYGIVGGNRYVVAYQEYGTEQTYRVKVFGGDDGYEYTWYTVTITFVEGASAEAVGTFSTFSTYSLIGSDELELEDVVLVDEYEASLEEIPENLIWNEELLDFVPAE